MPKPQLKNGRWTKKGDIVYLDMLPDDISVLYDSQDIEAIRESVPLPLDTTAVAVEAEDGNYIQVWFTTSRSPYFDNALFERIL